MTGPLTSLNQDEWYDVYRIFRPGATREEYDGEWADFQAWKAEQERKRGIN